MSAPGLRAALPGAGAALALGAAFAGLLRHAGQLAGGSPEGTRALMRVAAARPGGAERALTAAPLHGDPLHLGSNTLGLALLGGALAQAGGAGFAAGVATLGAFGGCAAGVAAGDAVIGASGGVHALAGALVTGGGAVWARALGLGWLILATVGDLQGGGTSRAAHGFGLVLGLACGWWLARRAAPPQEALQVPWVVIGAVAAVWALSLARAWGHLGAAAPAVRAGLPVIDALGESRGVFRELVEWQRSRRAKVTAHLDAERKADGSAAETAAALREVLGEVPGSVADLLGSPAGALVSPGVRPAALPEAFRDPASALPVDDAHEAAWRAFLAQVAREERALPGHALRLADRVGEFYHSLASGRSTAEAVAAALERFPEPQPGEPARPTSQAAEPSAAAGPGGAP